MSPDRRDPDTEAPRPAVDWGRVADGVFLAGLGIFFLVATTRGLPEGFWMDAISFWPVLLVSAGIRIVFEKTWMAWGVMLGPGVVLATLFWLAWGDRPDILPPGEWRTLSAERPGDVERAKVFAKLTGVHVDLEARPLAPSLLAEGRAASRESETRLRVSDDDGMATVRLQGRRGGFLLIGTRREVWELGLTSRLPLEVDLNGAFIRADVDLRKGQATYAEVNGAFNSVTLRLPPPQKDVTIRLEGAFNSFDVIVPEGTAVRYQGPGFPIGWVSRGPGSGDYPDGEPGYRVILDGAFTVVDIEEGPAPEGGWPPLLPPTEAPDADAPDEPLPAEDPDGTSPPADTGPQPPAEDPGGSLSPEALS